MITHANSSVTVKIKTALNHPLSLTQLNEYNSVEQHIIQQYLQGVLNYSQFSERLDNLNSSIEEIAFYDLNTLSRALETLELPEDTITEALAYVRERFFKAKAQGLMARCIFRFDKSKNVRLGLFYAIQLNLSHIDSDEEKRKRLKEFVNSLDNKDSFAN